jgi:hypothetical protein
MRIAGPETGRVMVAGVRTSSDSLASAPERLEKTPLFLASLSLPAS